ncbi:hypothetical protein [Bacillus solitudinis]|uniref:hypothetical protein n=1 Tax=Bacillus solitudinis TaxID=2014074 RepID=UPI000C236E62|nr:hypothetical protein [Bacillus solitudinis]
MSKRKKTSEKQVIYCGPSLKNVQQYSIYRGEPPEHVKKHMEKSAVVKELFVETEDFGRIRRNIKMQGTRENQLYLKALEYVKGVNN